MECAAVCSGRTEYANDLIGATPETDFQIINVAESLYKKFELKRVFYSAFYPCE